MALEYLRNKVLFMTERFDPNQTAISNNDTNENLSMILFLQFFIGLLSFCCRELLFFITTSTSDKSENSFYTLVENKVH